MLNKKIKLILALFVPISLFTSSCFSNQQDGNKITKQLTKQESIPESKKETKLMTIDLFYKQQWTLNYLKQKLVINKMYLTFTEDGKVKGFSGCNHFFGSINVDNLNLTFGALAGTRKMCAKTMSFESNVLSSLDIVTNYKVISNLGIDTLYLYKESEEVFSFVVKSK